MTDILLRVVTWIIGLISGLNNGLFEQGNLIEYVSVLNNLIDYVFEIFDYVNFIIPIDVIFNCVFIMIVLRILAILWNFVEWIILRIFDIIP